MGEKIVTEIEVKADTGNAEAGAKRVQESFVGAMVKSQIAAEALHKAYNLVLDTVKKSIAAAMESVKVIDLQNRALTAAGFSAERYGGNLQAQASVLQRLTGISDETISSTQTLALNMGVMPEKINAYVEAAVRLSRVTGSDLNSSLMALIKTESGVLDRTLKMVPGLGELSDAQLRAGDAIDVVNARMSEQLATTDDFEGKWTKITNEFDNLLETVGTSVIKDNTVLHSLDALDSLLRAINSSLVASETNWAGFGDAAEKALNALASDEARWNRFADLIGARWLQTRIFKDWDVPEEDPKAAEKKQNGAMELLAPGEESSEEKARRGRGGGQGGDKRKRESRLPDLEAGPYDTMTEYDEAVESQRQADAESYEKNLAEKAKIAQSNKEQLFDLERNLAEQKRDLWDSLDEYQDDLAMKEIERAKESAQKRQALYRDVVGYAESASDLIQGAIEASNDGSAKAWVLFAANAGKTIGSLLMARGAADIAMGTATSANPYTIGAGAAQIAAGGVEEAVGASLMVVGLAGGLVGSVIPSGGSAGGAVANGSSGEFGGARLGGAIGGGDRTSNTTVVIYGDPSSHLGRLVRDSIELANRRGV